MNYVLYLLNGSDEYDPFGNWEIPLSIRHRFLPGTELAEKTSIIYQDQQVPYAGIDSRITEIEIGRDYRGISLPDGTEAVKIINLAEGCQIIQYLHKYEDGLDISYRVFKQEIRPIKERVELTDLIK